MSLPRGVLPVLQMTYDTHEAIDFDALGAECDWVLGKGADGVVFALASELFRLGEGERRDVATFLGARAAGRGAVVISVGAESTRLACAYAAHAADAGATAVMATPPLCTVASEAELARYYDALLGACPVPVIVQDASAYVGAPLSTGFQVSLIERHGPHRVAFKPESSPVGPVISALRAAGGPELGIYEGAGGAQLAANFARGLSGTIPGSEIVDAIVALWKALEAGDTDRAYRIAPLVVALNALGTGLDGYLAIEKHLLVRRGVLPNARVRGPVAFTLDPDSRAEADRLFDLLMDQVAG